MQGSDFQRFRAVMAGMAELYQRELSAVLLDAYWLTLGAWSLADFEAAAGHLMARCQFMPRPADFTDLRQARQMTAAEAWAHTLARCSRWREGVSGDDDPAIDAAIRAVGGNRTIAMQPLDKLPFLERRFCELFNERQQATAARRLLGQPGHPDSGHIPAEPPQIGRSHADE